MIGLVITGRTYNPETYEISIEPVLAKVIDTGISSLRFWTSYSREQFSASVDFLYCAKWDGTTFSSSDVVRIPACLLTSISGATVDTSVTGLVNGFPQVFSKENPFGDPSLVENTGGIISKVKCPVIYFNDANRLDSLLGVSDFLICYPTTSISPLTFDESSLIYLDASKSNFISPTFVPPTPGGGGTSGSSGTSGTSGVGTSGTGGTSGTSGTSGIGISGSSGTSGTSGTSFFGVTSGSSGTSGSGSSGTSGTSGSSGTRGTSGSFGSGGTSGSSGSSGTSGSCGT